MPTVDRDNRDTHQPRCTSCGHPLTAHKSISRGIGPICLRRFVIERAAA